MAFSVFMFLFVEKMKWQYLLQNITLNFLAIRLFVSTINYLEYVNSNSFALS